MPSGSIRKRGSESWEVSYELGRDPLTQRRTRRHITVRGTRKDAEKALTAGLHQRDRGIDIEPDKVTVAEYLERWLHDHAQHNVTRSTFLGYRGVVRSRLSPLLGAVKLQELKPAQIQSVYSELLNSGLATRTVEYYHSILHQALKRAVRWQLVAGNVADAVSPPRPGRTEVRALTTDDARRLLDAAAGSEIEAIVTFALHTAMRQGEILALQWKDVDLRLGKVQVRRSARYYPGEGIIDGPTKSHRSRRQISLASETVRLLREHRASQNERRLGLGSAWLDKDLVFPDAFGQPFPARNVYRRFQTTVRDAGLQQMRFHDLRHTAATLMLQAGVNSKTVSERLGHATVAFTLDTYAHVLPDMQSEAAEALVTALNAKTELVG